ncbi:hypothetical protein DMENIID0001_055960 [Sergentomyia squamirostris]
MKVFLCFFAICVAVSLGQSTGCDKACGFIYEPVCCTYAGGRQLQYGSRCAAENYHCEEEIDETTVIYADGECNVAETEPEENSDADCAKINDMMCTMHVDPVCTTYEDGSQQTHSNGCAAAQANCQPDAKKAVGTTKGACETATAVQPEQQVCNEGCVEIFAPVCCTYIGGRQKDFGNRCEAEVDHCKNEINEEDVTYDDGQCKKADAETQSECNEFCPMAIDTVCCTYANDGTKATFNNECNAHGDACKKGTTCDIAKGACNARIPITRPFPSFPVFWPLIPIHARGVPGRQIFVPQNAAA